LRTCYETFSVYPAGEFCCSIASADEIATTKSGKTVNLKDDGTWSAVESKAQVATKVDSTSAIGVVTAYLSVNEYDDRLNYVLDPKRVRRLRDEENVGRTPWVKPDFKITTKDEPQNVKNGGWVKVAAQLKTENTPLDNAIYYLKKTPNGYKIDWESSGGYNKIKPAEFKVSRPTHPVRVRVLAQLSDYYNFEFSNAQNLAYSVSMVDHDQQNYGHGYVEKNSHTGKKIFNALKNGGWHYMVFDIKSLDGGRDGSHFLIHDVVSIDAWLTAK
jgi:hypothetical protein